jgi:hypothetical protein
MAKGEDLMTLGVVQSADSAPVNSWFLGPGRSARSPSPGRVFRLTSWDSWSLFRAECGSVQQASSEHLPHQVPGYLVDELDVSRDLESGESRADILLDFFGGE